MTESGWRQPVIDYIRAEAQPVDKFGHQPRLYALACRIGQGMEYDDDIVFAAAWMHDLGVFLGHRPRDPEELSRWDHRRYTIEKSRELLGGWGFPVHKLDAVAEAIWTHMLDGNPTQVEGVLLRDADILEQLGGIGALRAIAKIGRDSRYPTFSSVMPVLQHAVMHFPQELRLTSAKLLAVERVKALESLIAAINSEADGSLF